VGIAPKPLGVRTLVHVIVAFALGALAFAFGRWLRDPEAGGPLLALLAWVAVFTAAVLRLYRPGGLGRKPRPEPVPEPAPPPPPDPPDDRIDLNTAEAAELQRLPGIGPVGARRIVEEREANGPYQTVQELVRVTGFGPGRVHGLASRVRT
jgi:competence ComEA-like helix-hairpin-helix protein